MKRYTDKQRLDWLSGFDHVSATQEDGSAHVVWTSADKALSDFSLREAIDAAIDAERKERKR